MAVCVGHHDGCIPGCSRKNRNPSRCGYSRIRCCVGVADSCLPLDAEEVELSIHSKEKSGLRNRGPWLLAAGIAGAGLSLLYGWLTAKIHLSEYFTNDVQRAYYSAPLWQQLIVFCMLTPVCEELLFRGLVFGTIRRKISGWRAAVLTSALFSVLHGNPIQMLYAFPMGLVLQVFLYMEGGLEAPILLHICANLASVLTEYILR